MTTLSTHHRKQMQDLATPKGKVDSIAEGIASDSRMTRHSLTITRIPSMAAEGVLVASGDRKHHGGDTVAEMIEAAYTSRHSDYFDLDAMMHVERGGRGRINSSRFGGMTCIG